MVLVSLIIQECLWRGERIYKPSKKVMSDEEHSLAMKQLAEIKKSGK